MPKSALKNLPEKAADIWEATYSQAQKDGYNEERAAKLAWGAVKRAGYRQKQDGAWEKMDLAPFYITKAVRGRDGVMRWSATISEFAVDRQGDEMTPQFIKSAVQAIETGFRPAPVLCVSHIDHGKPTDAWVAGDVTELYIDGKTPKAKGTFRDTPLGKAAFGAVRTDWTERVPQEKRARISMGFFPHDIQPLELKASNGATKVGRRFMSGWVKHLAITRVPVVESTAIMAEMELKNMAGKTITKKEDAATIVGEDLAEGLVALALKSDLAADTPDMVTKQDPEDGEEIPPEDATEKFADAAPAKVGPGAAGKSKKKKKPEDDDGEEIPPEDEEEEDDEKAKEKAGTEAYPGADRLDQVEGLLRELLSKLGTDEMHPEEYEANRRALGNTGTNPPTNVKGEVTDAEKYMQEMSGLEDPAGAKDPEFYEFADYSEYDFTVMRFIDDWGDRVKAALLSDGDRTEKAAAVQTALYDFGAGVEDLIREATPPSSRDLADVVADAVKAAVTPVYNELAAVKAALAQSLAGNAGGPAPTPKALDGNVVLETALAELLNPTPAGPPAGLGRPRGPVAKSASDLAWESSNPANEVPRQY